MAKIEMTTLSASRDGTGPVARAGSVAGSIQTGVAIGSADQYVIPNNGRMIFRVSGGSADVTMTVATFGNIDGNEIEDRDEVIAANATRYFGPYPVDIYNNADGQIDVSFAAADGDLTIEVIQT